MHILERCINLIAPHICVGCGREGAVLCADCRLALPSPVPRCYRCQVFMLDGATCAACRRASPLRSVNALTRYESFAKDAIWRLKFNYAQAGAGEMGMLLAEKYAETFIASECLVAHVPTSPARVRQRGYDQAALMARSFARRSGLPYTTLLTRHGYTQQHGATRRVRKEQMAGAFEARHPSRAASVRIILIDDVVTTGATFEAAAKTLKAAGAKSIDALAFAQA